MTGNVTMTPVKSSVLKEIGHNPAKNTLVVQFTSGEFYAYANVTGKQYKAMNEADSAGKWFAEHIRQQPKKHPAKKL